MTGNDLNKRLRDFDRDVSLTMPHENQVDCVIVGGGALILLGYDIRVTHDIDILNHHPESLQNLMGKHDMNTNVRAYIDRFPDDYRNRLKKINIKTKVVTFYTVSLEDLVISKISSDRAKDLDDILHPDIIKDLNFKTLYYAVDGMMDFFLNDRVKLDFIYNLHRFLDNVRAHIENNNSCRPWFFELYALCEDLEDEQINV